MTIQFSRNTNIRLDPKDLARAPIGVVFADTDLTVEDEIYQGSTQQGINTYYRDSNGWYYWSGQTKVTEEPSLPETEESFPDPVKEEAIVVPVSDSSSGETVTDHVDVFEEPKDLNVEERTVADLVYQSDEEKVPVSHHEDLSEVGTSSIQAATPFSPAWYLPSDSFHEFFWQEEQLMGEEMKVAVISDRAFSTNGLVGENGVVVNVFGREHPGRAISSRNEISPAEIIGRRSNTLSGMAPEADIYLAKVPSSSNGQDLNSWTSALNWIQEINPDVLMVDAFINWDVSPTRLNQQLRELMIAGTLIFAPIGEGRGRRPKNYWPACEDTCIGVGAFDQRGRPMASNQLSSTLQLLGPGHSASAEQTASPSSAAAAYLAGIAVLARQWVKVRGQHLSAEKWKEHFLAAVHRVTADEISTAPSVGKFNAGLLISR